MRTKRHVLIGILTVLVASFLWPAASMAHNVSKRDASFVQSNKGTAVGPFLYLGAKHMVTGYDHILFLVGVIFFLYRLKDIVQYVSLFTLGHSVRANPYLIDAGSRFRWCTRPLTIWAASSAFWAFSRTPRPQCLFSVCSTALAWRRSCKN